jgi:hypothetical protein
MIEIYRGKDPIPPAMGEVPLSSNFALLKFANALAVGLRPNTMFAY